MVLLSMWRGFFRMNLAGMLLCMGRFHILPCFITHVGTLWSDAGLYFLVDFVVSVASPADQMLPGKQFNGALRCSASMQVSVRRTNNHARCLWCNNAALVAALTTKAAGMPEFGDMSSHQHSSNARCGLFTSTEDNDNKVVTFTLHITTSLGYGHDTNRLCRAPSLKLVHITKYGYLKVSKCKQIMQLITYKELHFSINGVGLAYVFLKI